MEKGNEKFRSLFHSQNLDILYNKPSEKQGLLGKGKKEWRQNNTTTKQHYKHITHYNSYNYNNCSN